MPNVTAEAIEKTLWHVLYAESSKLVVPGTCGAKDTRSYPCSVPVCARPAYAKGLCNAHYIRKTKSLILADRPIRNRRSPGAICIDCSGLVGDTGSWGRCCRCAKRVRHRVIKAALVELLGGRCTDCIGVFPLAVFDFHHEKEKLLSLGVDILNVSVARLAREVEKCILLCANCHRIRHARFT